MHPMKRPKAGDTEEDLFREEKEFLDGVKTRKVIPAASVVKTSDNSNINDSIQSANDQENVEKSGPEADSEGNTDFPMEHPTEAVLFEIKERVFDPLKLKAFESSTVASEVFRVRKGDSKSNEPTSSSSGTRKKSLFARTFDVRKQTRIANADLSQPQNNVLHQTEGSDIIGDKIHPYLAGMTEQDILEEQQKLLYRLDPKLVEFIKSKKYKAPSQNSNLSKQVGGSDDSCNTPMEMEVEETQASVMPENLKIDELPIDPTSVKKYPGMGKIELPKLKWAGVIKNETKETVDASQTASKSARFDFSGLLLPDINTDPTTYERALHNHGDEMERPGYTMDELLTLARSVNLQQRSIGFDTLGQIFSRSHTGLYDEVLEQSVFNLMDYIDLIHTIRKGLDNVDSNSINASLYCLAALLYPDLEEDCLDAIFLWPESRPSPLLSAKPEEIIDDLAAQKDMKDFEFLQLDLLEFLIFRTDVLTRIEYLLISKSDLLTEKGVTSLLKVLIRFARHSPSTVIEHVGALKFITENYVSPNWITLSEKDRTLKGIPLKHALKLMRILVESSGCNALQLYKNYTILPSVMAYLAYDQWREQTHVQEVESLVLEAFKIWIEFLSFGIAIDEYLALFPVLMQFLTFYGVADELNSFDLHHSSHLFALFSQILSFGENDQSCQTNLHSHWELVKDAASLIEKHCVKLLKILASPHLQGTYSNDLAVLSLGKGIEFLILGMKYRNQPEGSQLRQSLIEFSQSSIYAKLSSNLISHSILIVKPSSKTRYPPNFASIDGVKWKGELHPVLRSNSPYHLMKHFITFSRKLFNENAFEIVSNISLESYITNIWRNATDCTDYFVRFELSCIVEIFKTLPMAFANKFNLAYTSLAYVPSCCPSLFQDLLRVALEICCNPNDLEAVYQFYVAYFLGKNRVKRGSESAPPTKKATKVKFDDGQHPGDVDKDENQITFRKWTSKLTEAHWVFHPLESLYKRVTSTPGYVKENLQILEQETRGCLSFIHHCIQHHCDSIIQTPQDLVTVYCRICRIFMLGSPSVYIDTITRPLLSGILKILINAKVFKVSTGILFSKYKPSSSAAVSFFDFYTELVNEYFDNSYFDEIFASYLFLPLRSAEDANVKNCFWSHQYLDCVKLSSDKIPGSLEYLKQTPERDPRMLEIFTHLLKRRIITSAMNPCLYEIITAHLKNSFEFMTDKLKNDFESLCV